MKHFVRRIGALGACALLATGGAALAAPAAQAAPLGTLTVLPAKGNDGSTITAVTSGPCPASAANVIATMYGKGFPAEGQNVIGNSPIKAYPRTTNGGIAIAFQYTFGDTAKLEREQVALSGTYKLVVTCRGPIRPKDAGHYVGAVTFARKVSANGYRKYVAQNPPQAPTPSAAPTEATATTPASPGSSSTTSPDTATSGPSTGASAAATLPGATAADVAGGSTGSGSSSPWLPVAIVVGGLAAVLAGAAYMLRTRRSTGR